jgi:Tfp pilus assembly protein PilE
MSNSNNITPIGIVVAILIICILALIAIPRLREASRGEEASGAPKVLTTFGWDSSGVAEGGGVGAPVR